MRARGLFVTATDTGVGKTLAACALIRELRLRGVDAVGMKPVETGVGDGGPLDAIALRAAAGGAEPLDVVCPQRFALPAAPCVAAAAEGRGVDLDAIRTAFGSLSARHECVIVEGGGGLLVPLTAQHCMADLALELGLPLLVVARGRLGTVNHTLLTLEAAKARRLRLAGVVISQADGGLSPAEATNLAYLRDALGPLCIGEIPHLAAGAPIPEGAIDLDAVLRAVGVGSYAGASAR